MAQYFTGKGYGVSSELDISGVPFLTWQGPNDRKPFTLYDRVAVTSDPTLRTAHTPGSGKAPRLDSSVSSALKSILGGGPDDELDHKISLELGGSNSPANLWVQHGITSGASAASDTLENNLALDWANGRISQEDAWRTISEQKGFLLGEDIQKGGTFNWNDKLGLLTTLFQVFNIPIAALGNAVTSFWRWVLGTPQTQTSQVQTNPVNQTLSSQLSADIAAYRSTPLNQQLLTKIFKEQVSLTQQQLGVSAAEAGSVVKSYLSNYAQSKGVDPREMWAATNADIQKVVNQSLQNPNIFGVDNTTILKMVGAMQAAGLGAITVGIILVVVALFSVGWETALVALTTEGVGFLLSLLGLTGTGALGVGAIEAGTAMTLLGIGINMTVKEMYDNGYLLPTQQISAMKDALAIQKGLAGFLPSETAPPGSTTAPSTGGGGAAAPSGPVQLFIGHIAQGTLKPASPFKPPEPENIASADELAKAATDQLASFLTAFPGQLDYDIKQRTRITQPDGSEIIGTVHRVQTSVSKKGVAHFKSVSNKFAVADIYYTDLYGRRKHIESVILGPIDETQYKPTQQAMVDLANALDKSVISPTLAGVSNIEINPPITTPPAGEGSAPPPTPTPTPAPTPATTPTYTPPPPAQTPQPNAHYFYFWAARGLAILDGNLSGVQGSRDQILAIDRQNYPNIIDLGTSSAGTGDAGLAQAMAEYNAKISGGTVAPSKPPQQPAGSFSRTVTVNVSTLFVRTAPNTAAALSGSQTLVMGNQFTAVGWVYGESVSGEDRWWISSKGNYVWTGGTYEKP